MGDNYREIVQLWRISEYYFNLATKLKHSLQLKDLKLHINEWNEIFLKNQNKNLLLFSAHLSSCAIRLYSIDEIINYKYSFYMTEIWKSDEKIKNNIELENKIPEAIKNNKKNIVHIVLRNLVAHSENKSQKYFSLSTKYLREIFFKQSHEDIYSWLNYVRSEIRKKIEPKINVKNKKECLLFLSLDLTSSTNFKSLNTGWAYIFKNIFDEIEQIFNLAETKVWKYSGDEILFISEIKEKVELLPIIQDIYLRFKKACEYVEAVTSNLMSLKAASWIANISDDNDIDYKNVNIDKNGERDFIGQCIDEGFRLSHSFANKRQFVISFELGYLIVDTWIDTKDQISFNQPSFYFLGLKPLKGVWNNLPYPIIYLTYDSVFPFRSISLQEIENNELLKILFSKRWNGDYYLKNTGNDWSYNCQNLKDILNQVLTDYESILDLHPRIEELWEILGNNNGV